MSRARRGGVALLLAAVLSSAGGARPARADEAVPTITARLDRVECTVGDPLRLTITAVHRAGVVVTVGAKPDLGPFSVLERAELDSALGDGRTRSVVTLEIAAYDVGELELPPIDVTWLTAAGEVRIERTPPLEVHVRELTAGEEAPVARELGAPVAVLVRDDLPLYLLGGLASVGLLAMLGSALLRARARRARAAAPPPPPRPAHEVALERLVELRREGNLDRDAYKPFTFAVSEVVRGYLGARYGFDSLELTTTELLEALRGRLPAELPWLQLEGWLARTDLVKFAGVRPSGDEALDLLETAFLLVQATAPAEAPTVTPPAGGPPAGPAPATPPTPGEARDAVA